MTEMPAKTPKINPLKDEKMTPTIGNEQTPNATDIRTRSRCPRSFRKPLATTPMAEEIRQKQTRDISIVQLAPKSSDLRDRKPCSTSLEVAQSVTLSDFPQPLHFILHMKSTVPLLTVNM